MANRLDRMSRHDFPIAVRSTLNQMAFRMQKTEISKSAKREFDYKRTNIVQNLAWATKAKGLNISRMQSDAGIRERPGRQKVARGLAAQEVGGRLGSSTTPKLKARGGSPAKKVRKANLLKSNKAVDARNKRRQKFIAAAYAAKQTGSFLVVATRTGKAIARVSRFTKKKNGNLSIRLTWLYTIHNKEKEIKSSNTRKFIKKAYKTAMNGFNKEFTNQANRRLQK